MFFKNYKSLFIISVLLNLLISVSFAQLSDEEFDKYSKENKKDLKDYSEKEQNDIKKSQKAIVTYEKESVLKFKMWNKNQLEEYAVFKKDILKKWGRFVEPTNKKWVEYSKDYNSVSTVDFEKGELAIEVLISDTLDRKLINKSVGDAVKRVVRSKGANSHLPLETQKSLLDYPLLKDQLFNKDGQVITESNVIKFVESVSNKIKVEKNDNKSKAVLKIKLVPDHLQKRINPYLPIIDKYCKKYSLNKARVLATIEVESSFNPMAFSSAGAIGLMQLMPQYGGKEAYQYLNKKDNYPSAQYLFIPENNIHLGCVYIYLLNNKYFKDVKNSKSLLYCSVAAYNTGPQNTARAFINEKNVASAIKLINQKDSSDWVYDKLIKNLPYNETINYLKKIVHTINNYN